MNGKEIIFKIDDEIYAGQTSSDISFDVDMIETTTKLTGKFKTFEPGEAGSEISVESIFNMKQTAGGAEAFASLVSGTKLTLYLGSEESGSKYWQAEGYISSLGISAPKNDNATDSLTIQVTGEPELKSVT